MNTENKESILNCLVNSESFVNRNCFNKEEKQKRNLKTEQMFGIFLVIAKIATTETILTKRKTVLIICE